MKYTDRKTQKIHFKHQQSQMYLDFSQKIYNRSQLKKFTPHIVKYVDPVWWSILSWEKKWEVYSKWNSEKTLDKDLRFQEFCQKLDLEKWATKSEVREKKLNNLF